MKALFPLGQIVATPGVLESVTRQFILESLRRHQSGDFGIVNAGDAKANRDAIHSGARIFSAYKSEDGVKVWIITEAESEGNRASSCILLPSEY